MVEDFKKNGAENITDVLCGLIHENKLLKQEFSNKKGQETESHSQSQSQESQIDNQNEE